MLTILLFPVLEKYTENFFLIKPQQNLDWWNDIFTSFFEEKTAAIGKI